MARTLQRAMLLALMCVVLGVHVHGQPIDKVVVLMMENRSFDHMLGFMKQSYNESIDGLTGTESNPLNSSLPHAERVTVTNNSTYFAPLDPDHSYGGTQQQIYGDAFDAEHPALHRDMQGFVESARAVYPGREGASVMHMFQEDDVPVISTLAREFALFDQWHCSVPGPTNPNRQFLHAATSMGNLCAPDFNPLGYPSKTMFNLLHENGFSSRIYYGDWSPLCMFRSLRTPVYKAMFRPLEGFEDDATSGNLADYSFIEPRMFPTWETPASDQHPDHDVREGELLMKRVYEAVRNGPHWNRTLLVITYDEHGGFYDHVSPPVEGVPSPDDIPAWGCGGAGFQFDRLGIRVPTIVISPWVERGVIVHHPEPNLMPTNSSRFDHTSILATLRKVFGWEEHLTKRDAWAATFENVFTARKEPRTDCPTELPFVPPPRTRGFVADAYRHPNDLQAEFFNISASCFPQSKHPSGREMQFDDFTTQGQLTTYMRKQFEMWLGDVRT